MDCTAAALEPHRCTAIFSADECVEGPIISEGWRELCAASRSPRHCSAGRPSLAFKMEPTRMSDNPSSALETAVQLQSTPCKRHCSACPIPHKLYCGRASMYRKPGSWHFRSSALQFLAQKSSNMPVRTKSPGREHLGSPSAEPVAPGQHHECSS